MPVFETLLQRCPTGRAMAPIPLAAIDPIVRKKAGQRINRGLDPFLSGSLQTGLCE